MPTPWTYGPKQFDVPAGRSSLVQINMPYRGVIRTLSLAAIGASTGTFEIYNSEDAARTAVANADGSSDSVATGIPASDYIIYQAAIADGHLKVNDLHIPYVNRDGTPVNGVPRLWMRLTPDGTLDEILTFVLSITIEGIAL